MTLKEAIVISLEDINALTNYQDVYNHIVAKKYYDFSQQKTPMSTVSAELGDFIRRGDTRIKRIKQSGATYAYYLAKNEEKIGIDVISIAEENGVKEIDKVITYHERDLHKLLATFLKSKQIYSKTIYHEQSTYGKDSGQTWTHPDMVGIQFMSLGSRASRNFLKGTNQADTFKLSSYEIKKELNSDSELKKAFFQAVSNSSWANFGYLVALEFSATLSEEIERLNQSFGIGIIELNTNPYLSKILYPAKYRSIDYKTMDKLCKINKEFEKFIEHSETVMTAEEKYHKATEKELDAFCDKSFLNDSEAESYCTEKKIFKL